MSEKDTSRKLRRLRAITEERDHPMLKAGQRFEAETSLTVHDTEIHVRLSGKYQPPEPDVGITSAQYEDIECCWADGTAMPDGWSEMILDLGSNHDTAYAALQEQNF